MQAWASSCGLTQESKDSKRKQAPMCKHFVSLRYVTFSNVPLAKVSHMAKSRFQKWKIRFYLLMGEVAKSYDKGVCTQGWEELWPFLQTIPHALLRVLNSFAGREAVKVFWANDYHIWDWAAGKLTRQTFKRDDNHGDRVRVRVRD